MADSPSVPPSPDAFTRTTTAEVERLREKNDRQAVVVAQFQHEYDKARAENLRLREALAWIRDGAWNTKGGTLALTAREFARAALGSVSSEPPRDKVILDYDEKTGRCLRCGKTMLKHDEMMWCGP